MNKYRDLATRAFWTFVQTALSVAVVGPLLDLDVAVWKVAALAGGAAVASVLKSFAARQLEAVETPE